MHEDAAPRACPHQPTGPDPARLLQCLRDDDPDAALAAGLMAFAPCPRCLQSQPGYAALATRLQQAQQGLQHAWAARERHRARLQRLARRAAEREARRPPPASSPSMPAAQPAALPPTAAAILARAKAKAAQRKPQ